MGCGGVSFFVLPLESADFLVLFFFLGAIVSFCVDLVDETGRDWKRLCRKEDVVVLRKDEIKSKRENEWSDGWTDGTIHV